jgi:hypothetical protein
MIFVRDNLLDWAKESLADIQKKLDTFTLRLMESTNIVGFEDRFNWDAGDISRIAAEGVEYHGLIRQLEMAPPFSENDLIAGFLDNITQRLMTKATSTSASTNPMRVIADQGTIRALANIVEALRQVQQGQATLVPKAAEVA